MTSPSRKSAGRLGQFRMTPGQVGGKTRVAEQAGHPEGLPAAVGRCAAFRE
jgi:hypothetical protein